MTIPSTILCCVIISFVVLFLISNNVFASKYLPPIKLEKPLPLRGDVFGWSVSVSGHNALIGARNDNLDGPEFGAAYLFDTNGELVQIFHNPSLKKYDYFGLSVGISENNLAAKKT